MSNGKESLELYLDSLNHVLEYVIIEHPEYIYKELSVFSHRAWFALKEQNIFKSAKLKLKELEEKELDKVGLWKEQLEWKIYSYFFFEERFFSPHGKPRKKLKQLLKWADVILGSLTKVLPILEPLKEFKEGIEASINK